MSRLTIKGFGDYGLATDKIQDVYDKLGKLEDIEEELGIDLIKLLKEFSKGEICITHSEQ